MTINKSEEFVYRICQKSFLSLWSYANPIGKKGKELCDVLIVCDPDVIIFSVKDIRVSTSEDESIGWERWQKKAIEASANQIYGAEKWIQNAAHVIRRDGSIGLSFPDRKATRIHRVAVAFGGEGKVPLKFGDFGRGFIHVFDELSFQIILQELNTITDFIEYLTAKEEFFLQNREMMFNSSEEDVLAFYILQERNFPKDIDFLLIESGMWEFLQQKKEFQSRLILDRVSYIWDELISIVSNDIIHDNMEQYLGASASPNEAELALRAMAHERRFHRRVLGEAIHDFLSKNNVRSRILPPLSNITYVLLSTFDEAREDCIAELTARCHVARGIVSNAGIIVGLCIERSRLKNGYAIDLVYYELLEWCEEDQEQVNYLRNEFSFFSNPNITHYSTQEYPDS